MSEFLLNTGKNLLTSINSGIIDSGFDRNVEPLEIEAIHTKYNGNPLIVIIEPADLTISDDVSIAMSGGRTGYGRMDSVPDYRGTTRSIAISFKMIKSEVYNGQAAVSNNTVTANLLKQLLYPSYIKTGNQNTSIIKSAPYFKIKYGDLIGNFKGDALSGYFSALKVTESGGGAKGIGDNLGQGINGVKIPIEYSVTMTFNPLHDHVVGWYDDKFADDGRINWPFNTGLADNSTPGAPAGAGGNNVAPEEIPIPGSPSAVSAGAATQDMGITTGESDPGGGGDAFMV